MVPEATPLCLWTTCRSRVGPAVIASCEILSPRRLSDRQARARRSAVPRISTWTRSLKRIHEQRLQHRLERLVGLAGSPTRVMSQRSLSSQSGPAKTSESFEPYALRMTDAILVDDGHAPPGRSHTDRGSPERCA